MYGVLFWCTFVAEIGTGSFHGKSSQVEKNKLSNSAMKTSIYYFCIAYLICSKNCLRIQ